MKSADTCKFEQAVPVPRAGCGQVQSGGCRRLRQQALPLCARCGALHERARQGQGRRVILQGLHGGLQCLHHPRPRFLRGPQGAAPPTTPNPKPQTPNPKPQTPNPKLLHLPTSRANASCALTRRSGCAQRCATSHANATTKARVPRQQNPELPATQLRTTKQKAQTCNN